MSKKMMKRSLALGALMAFVITGSAMAAEGMNITEADDTGTKKLIVAEDKSNDAVANENFINISGKANVSNRYISVGYAKGVNSAEANYNTATVSGEAVVDGHIWVGNAECTGSVKTDEYTVSVHNNEITVKDNAKVKKSIIAGYIGATPSSGNYKINANENVVNLEGNAEVGNVFGTYCLSQINDNPVIIETRKNIVNIGGSVTVTANTESPNYYEDKATGIYGAYVKSFSQFNKAEATVEDNIVNVTGGTINADIYGAYAYAYSGTDKSENAVAVADGNTVNLIGGTINGNVYGGYSERFVVDSDTSDGNVPEIMGPGAEPASNNTISLQGDVDVSNAKLYGNNGGKGEGNKLEVDESYSGDGKINTVGAFDEIEIDEMKYGEAALEVENMNYKEADAQGKGGTKLTVNKMTMSGDQELTGELKIIKATNSNLDDANNKGAISDESSVTIYKGTSEIIDVGFGGEAGMELKEENIKRTVRNDQVLVIGESRAAATAFVNQGSEIIETGLDALARDNAKAGDTKVFAAVYGNASEYATGSHVKVNGWSGIVGVGKTNANGLTVGAFFENGEGNYRTYNNVNNEFMRGDGEANYNGGGFLIRKDNANGVYTEASLRAGNLQNELRKAVRGSEGLAGYDVDTFYYGAHVGVGKIIPRGNEGDNIDVYGKFIYTHHDSENFDIDGSDFHFDSVDSERLRLGFRINEVQTSKLSMYYGAAWEYEFGGDADNTTVGYDLSTPSLGGSTVIGEVGMHYLASEKWSLDLNVRGYSGQRDGFTGSVQANYNF